MKRSKLILGGTAFLLTVAGIVSSKASKNRSSFHYTAKTKVSVCESFVGNVITATINQGTHATLKVGSSLSPITAWTTACNHKLYTRAD